MSNLTTNRLNGNTIDRIGTFELTPDEVAKLRKQIRRGQRLIRRATARLEAKPPLLDVPELTPAEREELRGYREEDDRRAAALKVAAVPEASPSPAHLRVLEDAQQVVKDLAMEELAAATLDYERCLDRARLANVRAWGPCQDDLDGDAPEETLTALRAAIDQAHEWSSRSEEARDGAARRVAVLALAWLGIEELDRERGFQITGTGRILWLRPWECEDGRIEGDPGNIAVTVVNFDRVEKL